MKIIFLTRDCNFKYPASVKFILKVFYDSVDLFIVIFSENFH